MIDVNKEKKTYKICMKAEFLCSVSAKSREDALNTVHKYLDGCVDKVLETEVMSIEQKD